MSRNDTSSAHDAPADSLERFASCLHVRPRKEWVDELRRDQARRWRSGRRILLEEYVRHCPELNENEEDLLVLIVGEILLRRKLGQTPVLEDYQRRFPQLANQIDIQFRLDRLWTRAETNHGPGVVCSVCQTEIESSEDPWDDPPICPSCGSSIQLQSDVILDWQPDARQRRLGRYELIASVGVGAFGIVYKARDSDLDRIVAIKVPRAIHLATTEDVERFLREARSVAQLRHPSIVSVHEIGQAEHTPYLVSEFVEGETLADHLSSRRPAPRAAAELMATVADALHYAHEMGVVHRDVKPANIMLDQKGTPRLMDFGLARRDTGDATMTVDGQVLGTPAYMSPEQARGEAHQVDGRSDVYSLGVILYQLLTGELPFRGSTRLLLHQVQHDEPKRPRGLTHLVPRDLETICLKAMAKEASRRYATARDLADDLRRFLRNEPINARPIGGLERAWRWCRRKPALAGLTAIVAVLLVAIAAGGTTVVSILLLAIAAGGATAAFQFRRQAQKEKLLRSEADENLYYHRIALAHRDLTASLPHPGRAEELLNSCPPTHRHWEWDYLKRLWRTGPVVFRSPGSREFRGIAFSHDGNHLAAACGDGKIRVWDQRTGALLVLPGHDSFVYSVAFNPVDSSRLASSGNDGCVRVWDLKTRRETQSPPFTGLKVYAVGMANCVTFSPNGQQLAAASETETVQVWDTETGVLIHRLEGHEIQAGSVAFSRDGQLLASGSWRGVVRIWHVKTGKLLQTLQRPEHLYPVACLAFSPDLPGRYLAAGYFDSQVDIWDTTSGTIYRRLPGHSGFISSLAFHPDDVRRLASAGEDRTVRIWDVPSRRVVLQLAGHLDICSSLAFSPGGQLLASASYDGTMRVWDATNLPSHQRQERHTLPLDYEAWSVAISPDGRRVAAAGWGPDVQIWDLTTGHRVQNFPALFTQVVFSLAFGPEGQRIAVVGFDDGAPPCVLKVLNVQTGECLFEHREGQEIFATAFSPDGQWLALGLGDGSVKLLDAQAGNVMIATGQHDRSIAYGALQFRHDAQRLASASLDGTVRIWDLKAALSATAQEREAAIASPVDHLRCKMSLGDRGIALWSVSFSPDGRRLVTGSKDGQFALWDAETGTELERKSEASGGGYLSTTYSPNGRWIILAGEDCTARVHDAATLKRVHQFRGHLGPIRCMAVSDEFLVTGGTDKTVKVWDLKQVERKLKS